MKLLMFTQALDRNDPVLSVYHRWVLELAKRFESIVVICLKKGEYALPQNVRVLSLGKETGESRIKYVWNFYRYIITERKNYDAVFVHMNQEYVLLGGIFWKLFGKNVGMWRNHHAGNILTDIAAVFCDKVFCTSKFSYTARYKKTELMPVGIDTDIFKRLPEVAKAKDSILFLARIAPVKKPHVLVEALGILSKTYAPFTASIYGDPLPKDMTYYEELKSKAEELGLSKSLSFFGGVPNSETVRVYNSHEIFVNLSSSGMYDKTIFEAMACETLTVASNKNLIGLVSDDYIFEEDNAADLAIKLEKLLRLKAEGEARGKELRDIVAKYHSLQGLGHKLYTALS